MEVGPDTGKSKPERRGNRGNGGMAILCKVNERYATGEKEILPRFGPEKGHLVATECNWTEVVNMMSGPEVDKWIKRLHITPKPRAFSELYAVRTQKTALFIVTNPRSKNNNFVKQVTNF
jgi:hypothetical protein